MKIFKPFAEFLLEEEKQTLKARGAPDYASAFEKQKLQEMVQIFSDRFSHQQGVFSRAGLALKQRQVLLSAQERSQYEQEFFIASQRLLHVDQDLGAPPDANTFQAFLGLSDQTLAWVYREGYYYYTQKSYEEAEAIFCFLTLCNGLVCDYWIAYALVQEAQEKDTEALASFSMAALLNQNCFIARYHLVEIYLRMGLVDDAKLELECFLQIIKREKKAELYSVYDNLLAQIRKKSHGWSN